MKYRLNHTPENSECFKVSGNKAYFQIEGITRNYEFSSPREADEWKIKRSIKNRKEKTFEYFMVTNDQGFVDYVKLYKLHTSIGIPAPLPYCLQMLYAYDEVTGTKRDYYDGDVEDFILKNQRERAVFTRKKESEVKNSSNREHRLEQLTMASGLPKTMGELFLEEISKSTDEANKHLRDRAKLLGLL